MCKNNRRLELAVIMNENEHAWRVCQNTQKLINRRKCNTHKYGNELSQIVSDCEKNSFTNFISHLYKSCAASILMCCECYFQIYISHNIFLVNSGYPWRKYNLLFVSRLYILSPFVLTIATLARISWRCRIFKT